MTKPTDRERMRELGRRGGLATAAAKRRRRERDVGIVAWDVLHEDPEPVFRRVYESGNAVAIMDAIRFATEAKTAQLTTRQRELNERENELRQRERDVGEREAALESWPAWVEMTNAEAERIEAEVDELERTRDELRAAIELEAAENDMELVEVGDAPVA